MPNLVFLTLIVITGRVLALKDCDSPLLSDSTLTSSSDLSQNYSATHAQLTSNSAWCPRENFTDNEYLQVTFSSFKIITRIRIEGEAKIEANQTARAVTKYRLQISKDGIKFYDLKQNDVSLEVNAMVVRLIPLAYDVFPCMRIAIYGCQARLQEVCDTNSTCSQICVQHKDVCSQEPCDCPTDWSCHKYTTCKCSPGYKLKKDGHTCVDINECNYNNGGCDDKCNNTIGSFDCFCTRPGYQLASDGRSCIDIDECSVQDGGCNQMCDNIPGSYKCKCWSGYEMSADNHTCIDIDECKVKNGGCSNICVNLRGGHRCACPAGYEIDTATGRHCIDTNECMRNNGGCEMFCHNNNGSFTCSCRDGFELYDTYKCRDIDECARKTDNCDNQTTECNNYDGLFECRCKKGYMVIPKDTTKCQIMVCPPLVESQGTIVSPDSCLIKDARKVGDKCSFSCKAGYQLPDPSQNTMTCLYTARWDRALIYCRPLTCKALAPPTNGYLFPPFCSSTGNQFGQSCYYRCNKGYSMKTGQTSKRDCTSDGSWHISTGITCEKVFLKPWINCPVSITVALDSNSNTADVKALLTKPRSNTNNVKLFPAKYRTSLVFPAGMTKLTYVATNDNGDTASCTTEIIIQDKTPPRVVYCPPNIYEVTADQYKVISWKEPEFTDNVKVTGVTSNKKSGDRFYHGEIIVTYWAQDAAGNVATCTLDVSLKRKQCPPTPKIENGKLTYCQSFSGTTYCQISCNAGKQVFQFTYGASCALPGLTWGHIPDCVDAKQINKGGSCPSGMIHQTSLTGYPNFITFCVKCPRGYKYAFNGCIKCPIGYTSMTESSTTCTKCPAGTSTTKPGSRTCLDLCKPGTTSQDGFDVPLNSQGCSLCSMGYYADTYGAIKCTKCPDQLTTIAKGAKSKNECGIAPTVVEFSPEDITVDEGDRVEFVCKANGSPSPAIKVVKVRPAPDNLGGLVKIESIVSGSKQIGIRYIITRSTAHDEGLYSCEAVNAFGKSTKFVKLTVKKNIIGSGDGV